MSHDAINILQSLIIRIMHFSQRFSGDKIRSNNGILLSLQRSPEKKGEREPLVRKIIDISFKEFSENLSFHKCMMCCRFKIACWSFFISLKWSEIARALLKAFQ
jgi:hypothetical protein